MAIAFSNDVFTHVSPFARAKFTLLVYFVWFRVILYISSIGVQIQYGYSGLFD